MNAEQPNVVHVWHGFPPLCSVPTPSCHSSDGSTLDAPIAQGYHLFDSGSECDSEAPTLSLGFDALHSAIRSSNRILDSLANSAVPGGQHGEDRCQVDRDGEADTHLPLSGLESSDCVAKPCDTASSAATLKVEDHDYGDAFTLLPPKQGSLGLPKLAHCSEGSETCDGSDAPPLDSQPANCGLIKSAIERQAMASEWIRHTLSSAGDSELALTCGDIFGVPQPCLAEDAHNGIDTGHEQAPCVDDCRADLHEIAATVAAAAVQAVIEVYAAAEREQLMRQTAAARQLLEAQARERDARAAEQRMRHARRHIAVLQISNAWSEWCSSPARAYRVAAIVKLQACARALRARKRVAAIRDAGALRQLVQEALAQDAAPAQLKAALRVAEAAGDGSAAQQLQARLDAARAELCAKLWAAARHAPLAQYTRARSDAMEIAHLMRPDIEEAQLAFQKRQRKLADAVQCEATAGTARSFGDAVAAALDCGVDVAIIKRQQVQWEARRVAARAAVQSIATKPAFDPHAFQAATAEAEALGLSDAVVAAKGEVQARKARLMADIHAANAAGSLPELGGLQQAAEQLGLADALHAMQDTLKRRAHAAERKVEAAAQTAGKREFDTCVQEARAAGVPPATIQAMSCVWTARAEKAGAALRDAANAQPVAEVLQLAQQARGLGHTEAIAYAHSAVTARVRRCLSCVACTVQRWTGQVGTACPPAGDACETPERAHVKCCRAALRSAASAEQLLSEAGTAVLGRCLCHACSATASLAAQLASLEQLGMRQASAVTRMWLHWYVGRLVAQHSRSMRSTTVLWNYFGVMIAAASKGTERSDGTVEQTDICLQALASVPKMQPDCDAKTRQPVVSGERAWLLTALNDFQATALAPAPVTSHPSQMPVSNAMTNAGLDQDERDALTPEQLQAFAGGEHVASSEALHVSFSGLTSLRGMGVCCPGLVVLSVRANHLTSLHGLEQLGSCLRFLDASENKLASISSISALTRLQSLYIGENSLTSLHGIGRLTDLQSLRAANNSLAMLAPCMGHLQHLAELQVPGNCLSSLDSISSCTGLMHLDIARNIITSLQPLAHCHLLQDVCASENRVQGIDGVFCQHMSLQRLQLSANCITALAPLPWLPQLRSLDLADNALRHLPPFSRQPALEALNISFCGLPQRAAAAALKPLTSLTALQALETAGEAFAHDDPAVPLQPLPLTLPWLRELDHVCVSHEQTACAALGCLITCPAAVRRAWRSLMDDAPMLERAGRLAIDAAAQAAPGTEAGNTEACVKPLLSCVVAPVHVDWANGGAGGGAAERLSTAEQHACTVLKRRLREHRSVLLDQKQDVTRLSNELGTAAAGDAVCCMLNLSGARVDLQRVAQDMHAALHAASPAACKHGRLCVNSAWVARQMAERWDAAQVVQRAWRARRACLMAARATQHAAAVCIQAWARGHRIRRGVLLRHLVQQAHLVRRLAAVSIQTAWRGVRVRRLLAAARAAARGAGGALAGNAGSDVDDLSCDSLDFELPELGADLLWELDNLEGPSELPPVCSTAVQSLVRQQCDVDPQLCNTAMIQAPNGNEGGRALALPPLTASPYVNVVEMNTSLAQGIGQGLGSCDAVTATDDAIKQKLGPDSALVRKFEQQLRRSSGPRRFGNASKAKPAAAHPDAEGATSSCTMQPLNGSHVEWASCPAQPSQEANCGQSRGAAGGPTAQTTGERYTEQQARMKQMQRVKQLKSEWGFQSESTATACLQSQQHAVRAHLKQKQRRRLEDPLARLQAFRKAASVNSRAVFAPQDMPHDTQPVPVQAGAHCGLLPPVGAGLKEGVPAAWAKPLPSGDAAVVGNASGHPSMAASNTTVCSRAVLAAVSRPSFLNERATLQKLPAALRHAWSCNDSAGKLWEGPSVCDARHQPDGPDRQFVKGNLSRNDRESI
eukprot:jgi/Ulvmu1/3046/UM015_0086.1